jgi:hypothetical protein
MALVSGGVTASAGQPVITATSVTLDGASGGRTFDNLGVVPGSGGGGSTAPLRGTASGRCLDVPGAVQTNGTQTALWDCNNGANQQWFSGSSKQLRVYDSKCLDAEGASGAPGTRVIIWDCTGGTNQQWNLNTDGTVTGVQSGLCLATNAGSTANGAQAVLATCTGGSGQRWSRS